MKNKRAVAAAVKVHTKTGRMLYAAPASVVYHYSDTLRLPWIVESGSCDRIPTV